MARSSLSVDGAMLIIFDMQIFLDCKPQINFYYNPQYTQTSVYRAITVKA